MVSQIYPTELQLEKANSSITEASFWTWTCPLLMASLHLFIIDGDVPHSPSYGVYISQLIRFARVCSKVEDFHNRNTFLN